MKKKYRLYSVLTTSAIATVPAAVVPIAKANNNNNVVKQDQINQTSVNTTRNNSNDQIVNNILANNIESKEYYGDIDAATSINDYNTIDLNKLVEKNSSTINKISKAYRTLTDSYTTNQEEAKKTYIKTPVLQYLDSKGNAYDSELEALNAMRGDLDSYSSEIAYYEVKDWSELDETGKPKTVKINPLNTKDVEALKQLAVRNVTNSKSNFTINRYAARNKDNDTYAAHDYTGQTDAYVNSKLKSITQGVTDIVKKNLWLNSRVGITPDRPTLLLSRLVGSKKVTDTVNISWSVDNQLPGKTPLEQFGSSYDSILSDAKSLTNNTDFATKFVKDYPKINWKYGGWKPYANATVKDRIFGGQKFSVALKDGVKMFDYYSYYLYQVAPYQADNQIEFMGLGKLANIYFDLTFNQDYLTTKLANDSSFKQQMDETAGKVKNEIATYLKEQLNANSTTGAIDTNVTNTINQIADEASKMLYENIIGQDTFKATSIRNLQQVQAVLDSLNDKLLRTLDSKMKTVGNKTSASDFITDFLKKQVQTTEVKNDNGVVYTIDYNGVPLFKINHELFANLYPTEEFRVSPLSAARSYFDTGLKNNYSSFVETATKNLSNISNSLVMQNSKFESFTKSAMDNYSGDNKSSNFKLTNLEGNKFDAIQQFDKTFINQNNINETDLKKELNRREDDDQGYLNNQYGTFEAIYQYNSTLNKYNSQTYVSDALKANVKENAITDPNNVVVLYNQSKTPATIKYGRYVNYGYKFNIDLASGTNRVVSSIQEMNSEFGIENLGTPKKQTTIYDYNNNILVQQILDSVNGNYELAAKQAYENALNKYNLPASTEYVFYKNNDGIETRIKNQTTRLYVLTISNADVVNYGSSLQAASTRATTQYGFTKYDDLKNYVQDYVEMSNGGGGDGNLNPDNPTVNSGNTAAILNGFYAAFAVVLLAEIIVLSVALYNKYKNKNIETQFNKSMNNQLNLNSNISSSAIKSATSTTSNIKPANTSTNVKLATTTAVPSSNTNTVAKLASASAAASSTSSSSTASSKSTSTSKPSFASMFSSLFNFGKKSNDATKKSEETKKADDSKKLDSSKSATSTKTTTTTTSSTKPSTSPSSTTTAAKPATTSVDKKPIVATASTTKTTTTTTSSIKPSFTTTPSLKPVDTKSKSKPSITSSFKTVSTTAVPSSKSSTTPVAKPATSTTTTTTTKTTSSSSNAKTSK